VEILLWLVPPLVVTVLAMAWVGWAGREGRGEVDRDEAVRRLGTALDKDPPAVRRTPQKPRERSTGVAVRKAPVVEPPAPASTRDGGRAASASERRRDLAS
jgi:hypothetical protein